jgi:hypothetical protein
LRSGCSKSEQAAFVGTSAAVTRPRPCRAGLLASGRTAATALPPPPNPAPPPSRTQPRAIPSRQARVERGGHDHVKLRRQQVRARPERGLWAQPEAAAAEEQGGAGGGGRRHLLG